MGPFHIRAMEAGLFFLFIFLSGLWLSRSGKPYGAVIFNIHKLIGLAAGIFLVTTVCQNHQAVPLERIQISAIVVTLLVFAALVTAGGLLSIEKPMPAAVSRVHRLFPYLAVLSTAITLYLLFSRT